MLIRCTAVLQAGSDSNFDKGEKGRASYLKKGQCPSWWTPDHDAYSYWHFCNKFTLKLDFSPSQYININNLFTAVFGCVQFFAIPWTLAHQAPLSVEFSGQEYCRGLPFPTPGDLRNPGIKLDPFLLFGRQILYHGTTWKAHFNTFTDIEPPNFLPLPQTLK